MAKVFLITLTTLLTETPGGPPHGGYTPPGPAPGTPVGSPPKSSGKAITAMVLGIVGFCVGWIPFVNFISFVTAILAVVFGFLGMKEVDNSNGQITGKGMAITGIVLGILQLLFVLLILLVIGAAWADLMNELDQAGQFALHAL